jgi:ATP-dependent DNA helicase RecG
MIITIIMIGDLFMIYKESYTVELKREVNSDFKKEIIAFANSDGGEIFVGIDKEGNVTGVKDSSKIMENISNMIRDGIRPDLTGYTSVETINENGMEVVRVKVLRGGKRPYHLSDKGLKPNGVYIRHGITSAPATEEAIRQMLKESDGTEFDKSRSPNQDLTFEYASAYFVNNDMGFTDSNKRSLRLIDSDGYFTNTALLLSDQCEHSIKCAVYEGKGKMKFKARKEFFGSILKQMDDAYEYISLNNSLNSTYEKLIRVDVPDYPHFAIREALINAIVHRDYDYSGSTLINIYDDRIEFLSLGGLVRGITLEDIMRGISQTRNTVIANIFYRLGLIESYGTGIRRIKESYEDFIVQPLFDPAPSSFVVTLPNKNSMTENLFDKEKSSEDNVLELVKVKGSITRKDVELLLSCSQYPAINIINNLMEKKKIVKTGSARSTKYMLAY